MSVFGMTPEQYQAAVEAAMQRFAERHKDRRKSEATPSSAVDRLGIHEWVRLCHDLGWWDPDVTVEEFWDRVSLWSDAQPESPTAVSEAPMPSPSASSPSAPESGSHSPAVPPGGAEPDWVLDHLSGAAH